jgi:hypothetical protein
MAACISQRAPCWLRRVVSCLQGREVEDLIVNGTISSSNCGVVLGVNATTTHIEAYYAKAINYTVMITLLAFAQVRLGTTSTGREREGQRAGGRTGW